MVAWPPMEAAPEPFLRTPRRSLSGSGAAIVLAALVGSTLVLATFAGDGSDVDGILPVGGVAVVVLAAGLAAAAFGSRVVPRLERSGVAVVATTVALLVWTGATIAWSIVPDRSWEAFNRTAVFAAFLGLGIVLAAVAGRVAARTAAATLSVVFGAVLVWALLTKVFPSLDPEGDRVARLREPVEYWNALALIADVALALGLWLGATPAHSRAVRVGGALLVYVATLALALTLSRAGVVVAVGVVVLWLALSRERIAGSVLLVASAVPAAVVAGWAFTRPALVEDGAARSDRVSSGAWLGVFALIGAGVAMLLVAFLVERSFGEVARRRLERAVVGACALAVVAAVAAIVVAIGGAATSSSCAEVVNDPSRLRSVDLTNRWCWWNEAWDVFAANAPEGAGAGSFVVARKRYREDARNVVQPHSVPLQQLADAGVVGLVLFLAFGGAAAWACVSALRRLDSAERAAATALVAAPTAYALHSLVDYDWEFLAVTAPTMFALGVLVAAGRPVAALRRSWLAVLVVVLIAATVLASFSFPRLADDNVRASTRALGDDRFGHARERADRAEFYNPLSLDPLFAQARVSERRGFRRAAQRWYLEAVKLQPENPETWYALGVFEFDVRRDMCSAYRFLNNAYTLDPSGQQWVPGGRLDVAREAVDAGACEPD
jgi:hypothetical protein